MARIALVLDASVGVKWFSTKDELALGKALAIRDAHISQAILLMVPDLFYYEVTNAVVHKKFFSLDKVRAVASALFSLNLQTVSVNTNLMSNAVTISRESGITIYDSCYIAVARDYRCPLVTANQRHQKQQLDCKVIPIEEWEE